jgi:hypothetical protein
LGHDRKLVTCIPKLLGKLIQEVNQNKLVTSSFK